MSYSFTNEDEKKEETNQLQELRSEAIFCPKCGSKNNFSKTSETQTSFFCKRCSTKISDYWDRYQKGEIQIISCELCNKLTFKSLKYCVSCGDIKEKEAQLRSEMIEEKVTTTKSRFITDGAKKSFISGAIFFAVGIPLIMLGFLLGWDSSSILNDILIYVGFIFSCISVILLTIVPIIIIIIAMRKSRF